MIFNRLVATKEPEVAQKVHSVSQEMKKVRSMQYGSMVTKTSQPNASNVAKPVAASEVKINQHRTTQQAILKDDQPAKPEPPTLKNSQPETSDHNACEAPAKLDDTIQSTQLEENGSCASKNVMILHLKPNFLQLETDSLK